MADGSAPIDSIRELARAMNHRPVMLPEALAGLEVLPGGIYVDATFGRGGHSAAILDALQGQGALHAFDQDPDARPAVQGLASTHPNLHFHGVNFVNLARVCEEAGIAGRVNGMLFDLGVSSPQFDDASRGFSLQHDGPLDMRMDPRSGESAADWLARAEEEEIADVLWKYGDERNSRRIARRIVETRKQQPLTSTKQLADLILSVHRGAHQRIHPATRSFQAIRIFINAELDVLANALGQAVDVLAPGGRLVVISFHSLEDRMVKRDLRDRSRGDAPTLKLHGKRKPSEEECAENPRARSAMLRIAERLP